MEESQPWIVSKEIDFRLLIASQHDHIFENSRCSLPEDFGEFKAVAVEVNWVDVITGIAHAYAISLALLQVKGSRSYFSCHGIRRAIDRPSIESFLGGVIFCERHLESFVWRLTRYTGFGETQIAPMIRSRLDP